jgi:aerobic-type carbon monoxide dehydrogenase small subunit (CoxS/CutS family)
MNAAVDQAETITSASFGYYYYYELGMHVTTVEGLGSAATNPHPVQVRSMSTSSFLFVSWHQKSNYTTCDRLCSLWCWHAFVFV